ncbi:MAG TPA: hypothetical protein VFX65_04585 [Candidatus Limnocylindrales bacterium]|nr:hypothetical protein [Candidatus Limnocylindrales bacterium]
MSWATLRAAADASIARLPGVQVDVDAPTVVWRRGATPFAELTEAVVAIRVGTAIAVAAVRTPDTRASTRGPDWIEFGPRELDGHALDRLDAWLAAAHRRAAPDAG